MSAAQLLSDARQFLDRVGWTQGTERDAEDHACLVGALLAVCLTANGFQTHGLAEPLCLLRQVIGNLWDEKWQGEPGQAYNELEVWNDEPGRTYADVVALICAAEELAREQEQAATETITASTLNGDQGDVTTLSVFRGDGSHVIELGEESLPARIPSKAPEIGISAEIPNVTKSHGYCFVQVLERGTALAFQGIQARQVVGTPRRISSPGEAS